MPFVLKTVGEPWTQYFFTGKTYMVHGERFANAEHIKFAKVYISKKRAENARDLLNNSIANYTFEVYELNSE